jgi:hypothetical protein
MADGRKIGMEAIRNLIATAGGVASSNLFKVTFQEDQRGGTPGNVVFPNLIAALPGFVKTELEGDNADGGPARWISLMCDEANLPGSQFATGEMNGMYTGSGQYKYPNTRMFNDLSLSWVCDANMTPLKFLNTWMSSIYEETDDAGKKYKTILQTGASDVKSRNRNRSTRLNFPDQYTMSCSILKAEKNNTSELGRPSIRYFLEGVYPYAIDSTPLSAGTTQLVKVSANFYYERWYEYYTDQWSKIK